MDPIANFLTSIRNANAKKHEKADVTYSKIKMAIAKILKEEGYIQGFRTMEEHGKQFLRIQLKYTDEKASVIRGIKRISHSGLRVYKGAKKIGRVEGGMGVAILTTSKGIMSNRKARQMNVGGEILCHVW